MTQTQRKANDMQDKKSFDAEDFDRTAKVTPVQVRWHTSETPAQSVPDFVADLEHALGLPEESIKQVLARPEKKFTEAEIQRSMRVAQEIPMAEVGSEAEVRVIESGDLFEPLKARQLQLDDVAKQ